MYENEISSIIAYALNSFEYKKCMEELTNKKGHSIEQTPSPVTKRKNANDKEKSDEEKASGLLGFLRTKDLNNSLGSELG